MDILIESMRHEWQALLRLTPKILVAALAFFLIVWLGRVVAKVLRRLLDRADLPIIHHSFILKLTRWAFVLLGIVVALNILGLKGLAASLVAGGSVSAIVLGFAFRAIGENFLAGFSLVIGRSFRVGDFIASGDFEGQVKGIELRHTHIRAADGRDIFIPSIEIFSKPLVNYTLDGLRRLSFTLGLDYADDIASARELLLATVRNSGLVLEEPKAGVIITRFEPNMVELRVYFWIDTLDKKNELINVQTELMDQCRKAILAAGYTVSSEVSSNLKLGGWTPVDLNIKR